MEGGQHLTSGAWVLVIVDAFSTISTMDVGSFVEDNGISFGLVYFGRILGESNSESFSSEQSNIGCCFGLKNLHDMGMFMKMTSCHMACLSSNQIFSQYEVQRKVSYSMQAQSFI